ncbi:hypothetical protein MTR67_026407 [Solanum verrucosum]|uniref:Uncharacterized protein n=1 Tax=Solanum verrucosum TaxID=315347 RepID=A0AAF0TTX5_SOLVR|nr:hypothetical protein MTR67_026407 [Solanum verrucosum]
MISDESIELDIKVIRGADEDNHKDGGNKCCAAESSDSFLSCSERESMTTNQDANNQDIEARKLLAVKLVREAIKRILLLEVQDHSYNQLATSSDLCNEENSNESDTKNEECDKAYKKYITKQNKDDLNEEQLDKVEENTVEWFRREKDRAKPQGTNNTTTHGK